MKFVLNAIQFLAMVSLIGMALNMGGKAAESFGQVKNGLIKIRTLAVKEAREIASGKNLSYNWIRH